MRPTTGIHWPSTNHCYPITTSSPTRTHENQSHCLSFQLSQFAQNQSPWDGNAGDSCFSRNTAAVQQDMPQPILLSPLLAAVFLEFLAFFITLFWTSGHELKLFVLKSELFRCESSSSGLVKLLTHATEEDLRRYNTRILGVR